MMKFVIVTILFAFAYGEDKPSAGVYLFDPSGNSGVSGQIEFIKTDNGLKVTGEIKGLKSGKHGFHIHKLGHIAPGCTGTGPHFNPHNQTHGAPEDTVRHVGDLGNIEANNSGVAKIDIFDKIISLEGEHCIIGRAVVVHELVDDLGKGGNAGSLETGNAGGRLACGVIGILVENGAASTRWFNFITIVLTTLVVLANFFF